MATKPKEFVVCLPIYFHHIGLQTVYWFRTTKLESKKGYSLELLEEQGPRNVGIFKTIKEAMEFASDFVRINAQPLVR